jgi:hypothetical protein
VAYHSGFGIGKCRANTGELRAEDQRVAQQLATGEEALSRLIITGETVDGVPTESEGGRPRVDDERGLPASVRFHTSGARAFPAPTDLGKRRRLFAVAPPLLSDGVSEGSATHP